MFSAWDYEVKQTKEREIRERVRQAATDRLLIEISPPRQGILQHSVRAILHGIGHLLLGIGTSLDHVGTSKPTRQTTSR